MMSMPTWTPYNKPPKGQVYPALIGVFMAAIMLQLVVFLGVLALLLLVAEGAVLTLITLPLFVIIAVTIASWPVRRYLRKSTIQYTEKDITKNAINSLLITTLITTFVTGVVLSIALSGALDSVRVVVVFLGVLAAAVFCGLAAAMLAVAAKAYLKSNSYTENK